MDVYWLEQSDADVAAGDQWLTTAERARLAAMRFPKRQADWRLGRWTAKRALASWLNLPYELHTFADLEIRPASAGAPEAFLRGQPAPAAISISHRAGRAMCAIVESCASVGCDVETIEPHGDAFLADYFTAGERTTVARAPANGRTLLVALFWSAKESALKAMGIGLRLDTTWLEVGLDDGLPLANHPEPDRSPSLSASGPVMWRPLRVRYDNELFRGWYRHEGSLVRVVVSPNSLDLPIRLTTRPVSASTVGPSNVIDASSRLMMIR